MEPEGFEPSSKSRNNKTSTLISPVKLHNSCFICNNGTYFEDNLVVPDYYCFEIEYSDKINRLRGKYLAGQITYSELKRQMSEFMNAN